MVNAIATVVTAIVLVVVARYLFNKRNEGKMNNLNFTAYIFGITGGSLILTEGRNLYGYMGFGLFCVAAILKIIDMRRRGER